MPPTLPTFAYRRSVASCLRIIALLALVLVVPGCCGCCGGATVAPDPIVKIGAALAAAAAMASRKAKAGKLFAHYVERRAIYLTGKNASWLTETDYPSLIARIGSELDQVGTFVDERTTTLLGTDPTTPAHRDILDAAKRRTSSGPSAVSSQASKYRQARKERIAAIAHRACAVQPELWTGGDSTLAPTLEKDPLVEVLDRRLHAVEFLMMHDEGQTGGWALAAAGSGWVDDQRTSMFQYPWVDLSAEFTSALTSASLTVANLAPAWDQDKFENRIKWHDSLNRPRSAAVADWSVKGAPADPPGSPYVMSLTAAGSRSAALDRLIPIAPAADASFTDFWQRNWMFCDMMLATLHMQGLRFGRARRTGSDAAFDAAVTTINLLPLIPKSEAPSPELLMANGSNWFDGTGVLREELQVGDHIVYWNNPFVRFVLSSAFGLENSYVTQIDDDGRSAMLAGHGMPETSESGFSESMAGEMTDNFDKLRTEIGKRYAADNTITAFNFALNWTTVGIVKWAPFGENFTPSDVATMTAKGAWWVRLTRTLIHDQNDPSDPVPTMDQALASVPKSVHYDSTKHTQKPPSFTDDDPGLQAAVYLPLMKPAVRGGWDAYFKNPSPGGNVQLDDMVPDGSMIPGFFAKGPTTKIPVMRPKLTP